MIKNLIVDKKLVYLLAGKFAQIFLMLISVRIVTTVLTEKEVGQNYLLLTILMLLNFTCFGAINQFYTRKIIGWNKEGVLQSTLTLMVFFRAFGVGIAVLIAFLAYKILAYETYFKIDDFLIFIFFASIGTFTHFLLSSINITGNQIYFIKANVASTALGLGLSVLFIYTFGKTSISWLYGVVVAQLIFIYPLFRYFRNKEPNLFKNLFSKIKIKNLKTFLSFGVPVTATLFLQWGQNSSYRFFVEWHYSIEILGLIGVGYAVSFAIFSAVDNVSCQFLNPRYFSAISNTEKNEKVKRALCWNKHAQKQIVVYISTFMFIVGLSFNILKILVDDKFHGVYFFVMLGATTELLRVMSNLVYLVSQSELKTKSTVLPYFIGFLFMVISMACLNSTYSPAVIPIIQIASYSLILCLLYFSMKKILNIKFNLIFVFKVFLVNTPLLLFLLIPNFSSFLINILVVFIAGLYYCFILYRFVYMEYQGNL